MFTFLLARPSAVVQHPLPYAVQAKPYHRSKSICFGRKDETSRGPVPMQPASSGTCCIYRVGFSILLRRFSRLELKKHVLLLLLVSNAPYLPGYPCSEAIVCQIFTFSMLL